MSGPAVKESNKDDNAGDGGNGDEVKGGEPLLAIDCWTRKSGVQSIISRLLVDIVSSRPDNIMNFIHNWSVPELTAFHMSSAESGALTCSAEKENDTLKEEGSGGSADVAKALSGSECFFNKDTTNVRKPTLQREEEPTQEQLLTLFPEEKDFPYDFLRSDEELSSCLNIRRLSSRHGFSFSTYIGRGAYGVVVPARLKATGARGSRSDEKGLSVSSQAFWTSDWNGTPTSAALKARQVAVKISRIQGKWTLDENTVLRTVTDKAKELENDISFLELEFNKATIQSSDSTSGNGREKITHSYEGEHQNLEDRLRNLRVLLTGAQHVVKLVGDTTYSIKRDALLMPLELLPTSLNDCIHQRSKQCMISSTTGCPFPSQGSDTSSSEKVRSLFTLREVQHVVWSVCHALHFLNTSCNLCHLDVKAENILLSKEWPIEESITEERLPTSSPTPRTALTYDDPFPRVVLTDLGLAQPLGSPIMQLGDFSTMAPEVYWATGIGDPRYEANRCSTFIPTCDMWSVGCVILRMINGLDYAAWDPADLFLAMEENFVSPAMRHPGAWPMSLNDFALRCFERDPKRRMTPAEAICHPFLHTKYSPAA